MDTWLIASVWGLVLAVWCMQNILDWRQIRQVRQRQMEVPHAFQAKISLDTHQKAAAYTVAKIQVNIWGRTLEYAWLLWLTTGGGVARIDAAWRTYNLNAMTHGVACIVTVLFLGALLELPSTVWRTFRVEAQFGFNRMSVGLFVQDWLRQAVVGLVLGVPFLWAVLWLMASMGASWWLWVWCSWVGFTLALMVLYPTWIAPLFNRFTPLTDAHLAARVEALLQRCGFRSNGLFVMDGSKRSGHGNAYFTGFGQARRIVFFDTLLARLSAAEIEAVLAHELGHFVHHHVWKRLIWTFLLSLLALWGLAQLLNSVWFFSAFGLLQSSMSMGLLLFFLLLPLVSFWLQPISSAVSRQHEFQADAYAAQQTQASNLVSALVRLYQDNAATLTPDPWYSAWYDSHPPAAVRVAALQRMQAMK